MYKLLNDLKKEKEKEVENLLLEKELARVEKIKGDKGDKPVIMHGVGTPNKELKADMYIDKETGEFWLNI